MYRIIGYDFYLLVLEEEFIHEEERLSSHIIRIIDAIVDVTHHFVPFHKLQLLTAN